MMIITRDHGADEKRKSTDAGKRRDKTDRKEIYFKGPLNVRKVDYGWSKVVHR